MVQLAATVRSPRSFPAGIAGRPSASRANLKRLALSGGVCFRDNAAFTSAGQRAFAPRPASIAGMAELVDAADSKSADSNIVGIRLPLPAPNEPRRSAVESRQPDPADAATWLQDAIEDHRAGRLDDAVAKYDRILAVLPDYFDALHLSGLIALAKGDLARATDRFETAVRLHPSAYPAYDSLGLALQAA